MVPEKDNLTLSCLVSQRKRSGSILILRWFFTPHAGPTPPPPTSPTPAAQQPSQFLIAKLGIKKLKLYGNYTRRFPQPKFRLFEETEGEVYRLWILNVTRVDQGFYSCRVQEIRKHRNTWRASSNGSSTMQLTGRPNWSPLVTTPAHWLATLHLFSILKCKIHLFEAEQEPRSINFKILPVKMWSGTSPLHGPIWHSLEIRCYLEAEMFKGERSVERTKGHVQKCCLNFWNSPFAVDLGLCVWGWPQSSGISMSKQWAHTVKPHSTTSPCVRVLGIKR